MNVADAGTLVQVENIKQLKARYFRFVDSKQWDALRGVFTDNRSTSSHRLRDRLRGLVRGVHQ